MSVQLQVLQEESIEPLEKHMTGQWFWIPLRPWPRYSSLWELSPIRLKAPTIIEYSTSVHLQVLQEGSIKPLAEHMTGQQLAWLQGHVAALNSDARRETAPALACFLTGASEQGFRYSVDFYGCLLSHKPVRHIKDSHLASQDSHATSHCEPALLISWRFWNLS
jgi:hypothetical protein